MEDKEVKLSELSEKKEQELLTQLMSWFSTSVSWDSDWRDNAKIWYDYYNGIQWTSEEIAALKARKQAVTTYNHIKPAIDSVIGSERQNRPKITMAGRTLDDGKLAEAKTKLYDYITYNSRTDDEIDKMFKDGLVTGRGWIYIYPESDESQSKADIRHTHIDYRDMFTDPLSKKDDHSDARYIHYAVFTDTDIVEAEFEKFTNQDGEDVSEGSSIASIFAAESSSDDEIYYTEGRKRVRVIHTWFKDENGDICTVIWIKGKILYFKKNPFTVKRFPFAQYTVERGMDNMPYGMVKSMVSGQDEVNKRHSKALHYLNAKQVLAEEDAFVDWDEAEKTLAKPDGITKLTDGALSQNKVHVIDNTQLATAHIQMMQVAKENIFYTAGLNPTFVGQSSQYESSKKANIAIGMAANSIAPVLNKLRITRYDLAYITMAMVPDFYHDERIIRIIEPDGQYAFMPLNQVAIMDDQTTKKINDMTNDDVDIIIEDAPSGLNEREEQFALLMQIQGQTSRPIPMEVLLRYSSIKDKHQLSDDLKAYYSQEQQLQQAQQMIEQLQKQVQQLGGVIAQKDNQIVQTETARKVDREVGKVQQKLNKVLPQG